MQWAACQRDWADIPIDLYRATVNNEPELTTRHTVGGESRLYEKWIPGKLEKRPGIFAKASEALIGERNVQVEIAPFVLLTASE